MSAKQYQRKRENENHDNSQSKQPRTEDWVGEHNLTTRAREGKLLQFETKHEELANAYVTAHESYIVNMRELSRSAKTALNNARISYNSAILKIVEERQSESEKAEEKSKPKLGEIERKFKTDIGKAQTPIEKAQINQTRKRQRGSALDKTEFKQASDSPEADKYKHKIRDRLATQREKISKKVKGIQETFDNSILEILKEQKNLRNEMDKESIGDRMLAEQDVLEKDRRKKEEERHIVQTSVKNHLMTDLVTFAVTFALGEKDEM